MPRRATVAAGARHGAEGMQVVVDVVDEVSVAAHAFPGADEFSAIRMAVADVFSRGVETGWFAQEGEEGVVEHDHR